MLYLKENLQNVNQNLSPVGTSKIFSNEFFGQEVLTNMNNCNSDYNNFTNMVKEVINLHALPKRTPPQKKEKEKSTCGETKHLLKKTLF